MSLLKALRNAIAGEKQNAPSSSESAKNRLRILLINDRNGSTEPDFLPQLRTELVAVLNKYVSIPNKDAVEINYTTSDEASYLEMSVSFDTKEEAEHKL